MKIAILAAAFAVAAGTSAAQQYAAADGYRTCPQPQTTQGISVVRDACGTLSPPNFQTTAFNSLDELHSAEVRRDAFTAEVASYGACVNQFINSYRRPGADANSTAPDEAACAHSWAQDQVVQVLRDYGRACIDFSNRSMTDATISPWSGACYPSAGSENG